MNGLLRFALSLASVPSKTVDDLDHDLPAMARIARLVRQAEPILMRNKPHIDAIMPHLLAMQPDALALAKIIQQAWPDIVEVTPTVEEFIDFANGKTT